MALEKENIRTVKDLQIYIEGTLNDFVNEGDFNGTRDTFAGLIVYFVDKIRGSRPDQSIADEIRELERERYQRRKVYERLIMEGKLRKGEADRRNQRLESAINRLKRLELEKYGHQEALSFFK